MTTSLRPVIGPCVPTPQALSAMRPLGLEAVRLAGEGLLATRQQTNGRISVPAGRDRLDDAGNYRDLQRAAGTLDGDFEGLRFTDSDLYKYAEAVAFEIGRSGDEEGRAWLDRAAALVADAQCDDGYVNSYVQAHGRERYTDLRNGHELYCLGHMLQAAVAVHRSTGSRAWLDIAGRAADHLHATFGPEANTGLDGHPVVESALVELFRETGDERYLDLAEWFVRARGHATISPDDPSYYTDDRPADEQDTYLGHAVRALYFDAGVVDVAVERGDRELLDAVIGRYADMLASKTAITGGVGSRHSRESFGDRFELPPDRGYNETCAAIASIQLAWRLLLATGEAVYADIIERTLANSLVASTSRDGLAYFYVNMLQRRPDHAEGADPGERHQWYACACCPPNIMRTYASMAGYVASVGPDETELHLHQLFGATVEAAGASITVESPLPGPVTGGRATITVSVDDPGRLRVLHVRMPSWSRTIVARVGDEQLAARPGEYLRVERDWRAGDVLTLTVDTAPQLVVADPRADALRGCVAVEAGGLVFCAEDVDQEESLDLARVAVPRDATPRLSGSAGPDGVPTVALDVVQVPLRDEGPWPYQVRGGSTPGERDQEPARHRLTLVPYALWGNRGLGAMRVWLPEAR